MCEAGHFAFPYCDLCECDWRGTTEEICDQQSAACFCKNNVRGLTCNFCAEGTYNLQATNPDGCTECFCFGKTKRCASSSLVKFILRDMNNWTLVAINESDSLQVSKLNLTTQHASDSSVGADFSFEDISNKTIYFAAPATYLGKKMTAYGGEFNYSIYYTIGPNGKSLMMIF